MSTGKRKPSEAAVHEFVQLLAGWVPDDQLAAVRQSLADGQPAAAATRAIELAAEHEVPLLQPDIEAARSLTSKSAALKNLQPVASYPRLSFWFSAFCPDESLDTDALDQVMAEAAQERIALIVAVWRAWRHPLDESGPARRIYVVQVPDSSVAPAVAADLQAALALAPAPAPAGPGDVSVEVIGLDADPKPYQAAALDGSALLWDAQDDDPPGRDEPPFRIARVFDFARPDTGPGFEPGHRVITDTGERDRMLRYLTSGTTVLHTTARTPDILDPHAGRVVPASFRTDGEWIWTDSVAYYLEHHGLAPDEELAAHLDARWHAGAHDAETDYETAVEAASFLLYPPGEFARP